MYVIWRKRERKHYRGWGSIGDVRLTPVIVQSHRVDGKPKQEHVACLPSIIETEINEKSAVWFWRGVEEQLARLTNRIPHEEAEKIRTILEKTVPQPSPEFAKKFKEEARAYRNNLDAAFSPKSERGKRLNNERCAFSGSLKTAESCADCGEKLEAVYRERRNFGRGLMGGTQWTTGAVCKKCSKVPYVFRRFGPCETCEREVFISRSIPARRAFCSTRCGQAYYRQARRDASLSHREA